jgi:hypothetical protein
MIANRFLAGVLVGLPLSALCVFYTLLRRQYLVSGFKAMDATLSNLSDNTMWFMMLGAMAFVGPMLGIMAGLVYGWVPSDSFFLAVALGLGALFTVGALVSRTPFTLEKVVLNVAVAVVFGLFLPRLVGG